MDTLFGVWAYTQGIFWLVIIAVAGIAAVIVYVIGPAFNWLIDKLAGIERYEPADIGEAAQREVVYRDCDGSDGCRMGVQAQQDRDYLALREAEFGGAA